MLCLKANPTRLTWEQLGFSGPDGVEVIDILKAALPIVPCMVSVDMNVVNSQVVVMYDPSIDANFKETIKKILPESVCLDGVVYVKQHCFGELIEQGLMVDLIP
jgi:hypothetical protein